MAAPAPGGGRFGLAPDRQRLLVIAGGGAVALLLFLLILLPKLSGGGGGGGSTAQPPLVRPSVSTTTTIAAGAAGAPSESFEVFSTKNPFQPLVNPAGTGGGGSTATTSPGGSTGGGTTETTVAGTGGASGGAATAPRRSQQVALLNVYTKSGKTVADVRVNDTVYTAVAPGQTFASNFQVVSLQGQCGTFLFGDERFQLCKGEEVLK